MGWRRYTLQEIAPSNPRRQAPDPSAILWQLSLDQIEGHTGAILTKQTAPASEAGASTNYFDQSNVLYSKLRPYLNKVVVPNEPGIASTELVPLSPRPELVYREYLAYYLRSPAFLAYASQYVTGAKMPRVILDRFWSHEICLPSLLEQRHIIDFLDQANHIRRMQFGAKRKARRILPAIFIKMFGDPATNPMNWRTAPFGDAIVQTRYGTSKRGNTEGKGVFLVRMNNVSSSGEVDLNDHKFVELDPTELERQRLRVGDVLFNRTNSVDLVGKTGLWRDPRRTAVAASYLIRIRVDTDQLLPSYVWALMNTAHMKGILTSIARRAISMANINATELRNLPWIFPPIQIQKDFASICETISCINEDMNNSLNKTSHMYRNIHSKVLFGTLTTSWQKKQNII